VLKEKMAGEYKRERVKLWSHGIIKEFHEKVLINSIGMGFSPFNIKIKNSLALAKTYKTKSFNSVKKIAYIEIDTHAEIAQAFMIL
jgi:hypothetical protein